MKGHENAIFQNRRQIKASDVTRAIQATGSLDWLREDFPDVKPPAPQTKASRAKQASDATDDSASAAARPSGADFFKPQTVSSSAGAEAADEELKDDAA